MEITLDEYESLPSGSPLVHMAAGSLAGIMEHCVMYPVDSVKTRMQTLLPCPQAHYRSILEALYKMVKHEGALRPIRGITAVVLGAGPAHALYFSCYEYTKNKIANYLNKSPHHSFIAHGIAGSLATLAHDAVMIPAEVRTLKAEGFHAFYRAYPTQLFMNIPFQSVHFIVYESMQNVTNPHRVYNPPAHLISGAMAGAIAAAFTTPLDVCKTLLNTQEKVVLAKLSRDEVPGLLMASRLVYQLLGVPGFFAGITARIFYQAPATAIAWSVYEFLKYCFTSTDTKV